MKTFRRNARNGYTVPAGTKACATFSVDSSKVSRTRPQRLGRGDEAGRCVPVIAEEFGDRGLLVIERSEPAEREFVKPPSREHARM